MNTSKNTFSLLFYQYFVRNALILSHYVDLNVHTTLLDKKIHKQDMSFSQN